MLTEAKSDKIDPRYILAHDVDPHFKEAFINAPSHLPIPTRHHHAFLSGVMGINPAKEKAVVRQREENVILDGGVERPLTGNEEKEFMRLAERFSKGTSQVEGVGQAIHVINLGVLRLTLLSLDASLSDDGGDSFVSLVVGEVEKEPERVATEEILREDVEEALSCLTAREARVISMRFGVNTAPTTLDGVGRELGVTRERVRQIEAKALKKLRGSTSIKGLRSFLE